MATEHNMFLLRSMLFRFQRALLAIVITISLISFLQGVFQISFYGSVADANTCPGGLPSIWNVVVPWKPTDEVNGVPRDVGNEYLKCEIQNIYNIGFYVAVGLATIMVIIGGIRYTTAGGNSSEAGEAKTMIKEALIGLGIALLAAAFTAFLQS